MLSNLTDTLEISFNTNLWDIRKDIISIVHRVEERNPMDKRTLKINEAIKIWKTKYP